MTFNNVLVHAAGRGSPRADAKKRRLSGTCSDQATCDGRAKPPQQCVNPLCGAAAGGGAVVQQIRGRDAAQSTSFSPSAGNGSAILTVHDVWGGKAMASELLNVVPVKLDTALMGSVLAQIGDLSASALASNSSKGNAAATQLVGALAATLNMQVTSYLSLLLLGDFLLLATSYLPLCLTRRAPRPRLRATCRASPTQRCSSCARASSPSSPPDRRP